MTVAGQTPKLDANEIWEFLFNRTKDAVPEELTNEILADLAAHINKLWIDPLTELQHRREAEAGTLEGWVLVPREPTHEMLTHRLPGTNELHRWDVWTAMLAASPSPPASGVRVKVKPLEWQRRDLTMQVADTILGTARVWTHHEAEGVWFWQIERRSAGQAESEDAAVAALEADYAAKVLSALGEHP